MKAPATELPVGKLQPRRKTSKLAPLIALIILLSIPLYFPSLIKESSRILLETSMPYADNLEDPITIIEAPQSESAKDPCSIDSAQCHDGAAEAVDRPATKNREKVLLLNYSVFSYNRLLCYFPTKGRRRKRIKRPRSSAGAGGGTVRSRVSDEEQCDLFSGEWVADPEGPYYTNDSCEAIQEHQNCLKFGRPDTGFLKWRWKPDGCELPMFDPRRFLQLVTGKSLAFVGDSVARNHMQSLICLLSRVENPVDVSTTWDQNKQYEYREHDFNISMFWSPYLVRTEKTHDDDDKQPFKLYLDEFDRHWAANIAPFDYLIISAGHWFYRPTYFYLNRRLVGCLYCPEPNLHHLTYYFSYRRAFRTAFRAINDAGFRGVAFLRTYAPSHFEGAAWDKGGDCVRTAPYRRSEVALEDYSLKMYLIQLDELRIAQRAGRRRGGKFRLLDATTAMLLRPDGHPSKYGHWQGVNQTFANDCVHWCLPGPIDAWNEFLQELLEREDMVDKGK